MKRIALIGSTGSIGENALAVVKAHSDRFKITALAVRSNVNKLAKQIKEFDPKIVAVYDERAAAKLKSILDKRDVKVIDGPDCLREVVSSCDADIVICGVVGACGLNAIFSAIESGKDVGIANKEPLVMAGDLIMAKAKQKKVHVLPIDSEHSAIWQCLNGLNGRSAHEVKRLILTASGGPFLGKTPKQLQNVTPEQAIRHPRWRMGKKISIDSATLMNKGLEVKEAHHLFDMPIDKIDILVHREAVIHSMVEFVDGSHIAQLAINDMKLPIQYALSYPERLASRFPRLDLVKIHSLTFELPDRRTFPCLDLAYVAWKKSGTAPAVLNAANEVAVERFLSGNILFLKIPRLIEKVLSRHRVTPAPSLKEIIAADRWAREEALKI